MVLLVVWIPVVYDSSGIPLRIPIPFHFFRDPIGIQTTGPLVPLVGGISDTKN